MGMDASFTIWAGITFDEGEYGKLREIVAAAPPGVFQPPDDPEDEYERPELEWDAYRGKAPGAEGLQLETYDVAEGTVGFGARIFHTDWDYGAQELNLLDLAGKAAEVSARLREVLAEWGVEVDVRVYGACDYS